MRDLYLYLKTIIVPNKLGIQIEVKILVLVNIEIKKKLKLSIGDATVECGRVGIATYQKHLQGHGAQVAPACKSFHCYWD